ncbi:MAG: AmmeMemoRadiSam system radical SAM enzyme [Thermoplasmata archaeon]
MMKEADFWKTDENAVICGLCAHGCRIEDGDVGLCRVRKNQNGTLYSLVYGKVASLTPDPIEKKPLYHFHPGTKALSFGTVGCNFSCLYCQNMSLSQGDPSDTYLRKMSVDEIVKKAKRYDGIAWTYNEPTVSYEFSYDVFKELKEQDGGYTVYVTNGYMEREPLEKIAPYLDAVNIDVKAFRDEFYREIVGAKLEPVLETCKRALELDIHVELTYLVVPGYNDSREEIAEFCSWVRDTLSENTVVHFSRFHPDHKMRDVSPTPEKKMREAREIARKVGLNYVYLGNLPADNDLYCPGCGEVLLKRGYFSSEKHKLQDGRCSKCGEYIHLRY